MIYRSNYSFVSLFVFCLCQHLPANCQASYDPNLGHFYMGRQKITIENNAPIINDRTGSSTANGGANGALPGRPIPLPQAGWQPYAPVETPGINPNLPKVPGPVRQAHNPPVRNAAGNKGRAGRLTAGAHGKTANPNGVRSYSPYAKYAPPVANPQATEDLGVNTRVKGNLLHWAHPAPKQQ